MEFLDSIESYTDFMNRRYKDKGTKALLLTIEEAVTNGVVTGTEVKEVMKQDKTIGIRISAQLLKKIEKACVELNQSKSTLVKRAIGGYLDYHQKVTMPYVKDKTSKEK